MYQFYFDCEQYPTYMLKNNFDKIVSEFPDDVLYNYDVNNYIAEARVNVQNTTKVSVSVDVTIYFNRNARYNSKSYTQSMDKSDINYINYMEQALEKIIRNDLMSKIKNNPPLAGMWIDTDSYIEYDEYDED